MNEVAAVVGNSSSGILEAPALQTATVNVGSRQAGRLMASSIVTCAPDRRDIAAAIARVLSPEFKASLVDVSSPFGSGGASALIVAALEEASLDGILMKHFHDVPVIDSVSEDPS